MVWFDVPSRKLDVAAIVALAASLAVPCIAVGVVFERRLFFAEAKHTVTLYYGANRA